MVSDKKEINESDLYILGSPFEERKYEAERGKFNTFLVKRDDKLPLKCSKQRSIPQHFKHYIEKGVKKFHLHTSGNSGFVAIYYFLKSKILFNEEYELNVYFSTNQQISEYKLNKYKEYLGINLNAIKSGLKDSNLQFSQISSTPKINLWFVDKVRAKVLENIREDNSSIEIRASIDDISLVGYKSLGHEIIADYLKYLSNFREHSEEGRLNEISNSTNHNDNLIDEDKNHKKYLDIYIPSSSGATVIGMYQGIKERCPELKVSGREIRINIIQTTLTYALIKRSLKNLELIEHEFPHPADSITELTGKRRPEIEEILKSTDGIGIVVDVDSTLKAMSNWKKFYNESISPDSALAYASIFPNRRHGKFVINEDIHKLVIFTG